MPLTWLEINQKNLVHNIREFQKIAPNSQIWPVIKSNAYGHGLKEIASILDKEDLVKGMMVVSLDEAIELNQLTQKQIMVLSYFDYDDNERQLKIAAEQKISLPIYDLETAAYLDHLAQKLKLKFLINIKIDTGTSRLGFVLSEAEVAIERIKKYQNLEINSFYTHFAESEAEEQAFTTSQLEAFSKIATKYPNVLKHAACSAATLSQKEAQQDIIRLGLSLYGLHPSEASKLRAWRNQMCLQPVLTWKTKIIQIKEVKAGTTVGYNRTYTCPQDCKLAILPIGYNEGYDRSNSNQAEVLIAGVRYKVRGNICMNLSIVELPLDSEFKRGEEVVLLGKSGGQYLAAEELATWAQTINYEIVTRINSQIPRLII
ncbi:alanine racemase [Candidatus Nomurabacteria bacterium]|nr:alanine racemase [Candidatus Nomurabacteria bacterium]